MKLDGRVLPPVTTILAAATCAGLLAYLAFTKLATLRAMAIAPLASRWLARWVRPTHYTEDEFLRADDAAERWIERRRQGLAHLAERLRTQYAQSTAWGDSIRDSFSDLRFTDVSRVPFPFVRAVRERFNVCSVVTESNGPRLKDLDGN